MYFHKRGAHPGPVRSHGCLPVDSERLKVSVSAMFQEVQEPMQSHLTLRKAEAGLSGDQKGESYD
jgi:hypothetical protein